MKNTIKFGRKLMLILPVSIFVALMVITLVANITAYKSEKTYIADYYYMVAEVCAQKANNKVRQLTSETEYAGDLISRSMLQLDAMNRDFETALQNSEAEQGLVFTDSKLIYGNSGMYEKLGKLVSTAELNGETVLTDLVLCDDGVYRFAVATPVTMSYGGRVTVALVYSNAVLNDIVSVSLPESTSTFIIDSNGYLLSSGGQGALISDKEGLCSPNLLYDATRRLTPFKDFKSGKKYYAYSRSLGIENWSVYFAMPSSAVNARASQSIGGLSRITIISLLFLLGLFLYYYFGMVVTRRKEEIDHRKFQIVSRQSSRAVFEYDKIRDKFYFISDCENIKIPGGASSLSRAMGLTYIYPQDRQPLLEALESIKTNSTAAITIRASYFGGDSSFRWYYFTVTRLAQKGIGSSVLLGIMEDIDEREKERIALFEKATTDSLTGLYNREETERLINERQQIKSPDKVSAFVIFDLDDFKGINDSYGHDMGDRALRYFTDKLKSTFRTQDVIGRIGGDEFVVYVTYSADEDFVQRKFAFFADSMSKHRADDEKLPYISCSAGYVTAKEDDVFETLYVRADKALYRAKTIGKNCAVCGDT